MYIMTILSYLSKEDFSTTKYSIFTRLAHYSLLDLADHRRRDPVGELAGLNHASHQRGDERAISSSAATRASSPPFGLADDAAVGRHPHAGEGADLAVEGLVRQGQAERHAGLLEHLVPARRRRRPSP